jgi:multiple sugar transport system substrate-binding protein
VSTRSRIALAAALLSLALALGAGCAARERGVTLRFWAMGREGEVVEELVRDFERENPGIRVEVQQIPWSAAHEKLLTAHVGASTPDLAQLGNTWIPEFAALHALQPLDAFLDSSTTLAATDFFSGSWDGNVVAGRTLGIPWYVDTRVLFYRRDLLEQAGWKEMPTTWAEWRRALEGIKRVVGPSRYAIFFPLNEWNPPMILGLQAGSPILRDHDTRGAFSGPEFSRAFDFFVGIFRDGLAPPLSNQEIANMYQEFERGYFAMTITGPWNLGEFRRRLSPAAQDLWCTAPLPGPDGPGLSMAGGSSLVMFRRTRHPEAVWRLMTFLSRPEQQVRFYRLTGDLPSRTLAWGDSALAQDPCTRAFRVQLERVAPWPKVPEWEPIAIRLQDWAERAVRGRVAPAEALAGMDREVDLMLEKRRWLVERQGSVGLAP